jgi:prepilin-type N-terminal cleavage/methylation domain-containing protein
VKGNLGDREWRRLVRAARGFSMIETLTVIAITLIIAAMAVPKLQPMIQEQRANAGVNQVVGQLRQAREFSISQRRGVQVVFDTGAQTVTLIEKNSLVNGAGPDVVLSTLALEGTVIFTTFPGVPDTPDNFGNAGAVEFEGIVGGPTTGMMFLSDGTFVDMGTGVPINGSVFMGVSKIDTSARAVTILGATGRVRPYRSTPFGWIR